MPQLDFAQALPQILWLTLVFGLIYVAVARTLPRVTRVVESRRQRIAADLAEAEAARAAADAASGGGSSALEEARSRALQLTGRARDEAAAATGRRLAEIDAVLGAQAEAAARRLAAARKAALADLHKLASEATADLVARVSGLAVSPDEAAEAVRQEAA